MNQNRYLSLLLCMTTCCAVSCSTPDKQTDFITIFKKQCSDKIVKSCTNLASTYLDSQLFAQAKLMYKFACDKNEPSACYHLAMLKINEGYSLESIPLLNKACDKNFQPACRQAHLIEHQRFTLDYLPQDATLKCNNNVATACRVLGYNYFNIGEYSQSKLYFKKACAMNLIDACNELGTIEFLLGNTQISKLYYEKACIAKYPHSCEILSRIK